MAIEIDPNVHPSHHCAKAHARYPKSILSSALASQSGMGRFIVRCLSSPNLLLCLPSTNNPYSANPLVTTPHTDRGYSVKP